MRRRGLFIYLFSGLLGMMGCNGAQKKMPEGELVSVELTHSGTMAGYLFEGRVKRDSMGTFVLRAMKESYGPLFEKQVDAEVMHHFYQIIEEAKMYKYKDVYLPKYEVLDGRSWSFCARFSDGSEISSHGSNAGPKDDGLERIYNYMVELVEDGVQIESPDE